MGVVKDITGNKYGRLTVLGLAERHIKFKNKDSYWLCQCACGKEKIINAGALKRGVTKSCGCLNIEKTILMSKNNITHGKTNTREYSCWRGMMRRCHDEKVKDYPRYGAVGITVCDEWHKFENFYAALGDAPSKSHSLDRIDGTLGYFPGNVKWSTSKEQANNRKSNVLLTFDGRVQNVVDWASELGVKAHLIYDRLYAGWSVEDALTTPKYTQPPRNLSSVLTFPQTHKQTASLTSKSFAVSLF